MKVDVGGNRLGSGGKNEIALHNYKRSSHDTSTTWRNTQSFGTLVPFLSRIGLPGSTTEINLNANAMTVPTLGPMFGSVKWQMDVFKIPMRLYMPKLHMNHLKVGLDPYTLKFPKINVEGKFSKSSGVNQQIHPSSVLKYLGLSGAGYRTGADSGTRPFNAIPLLAYYDIYLNYYANKQEEKGVVVHNPLNTTPVTFTGAMIQDNSGPENIFDTNVQVDASLVTLVQLAHSNGTDVFDVSTLELDASGAKINLQQSFLDIEFLDGLIKFSNPTQYFKNLGVIPAVQFIGSQNVPTYGDNLIRLQEFPLEAINDIKTHLFKNIDTDVTFDKNTTLEPLKYLLKQSVGGSNSYQYNSEGLLIKTYQSDLYNNWVNTDWITGVGGIQEATSVDTTSGSFTMDSLIMAKKVYNLLNRVAVSGGSYDDYLNAVYTHERAKGEESPVYQGSLIKEIAFQEVFSNVETGEYGTNSYKPQGHLTGKGVITGKHKGGYMKIRCDEPCWILGISSLTPRIDYSTGNAWELNLDSLGDLHKPQMDGIAYQDLVGDQFAWWTTHNSTLQTKKAYGKVPAWINYMTDVNRCYGEFAEPNKAMWMTFNRGFEITGLNGELTDFTSYIEPNKFNNIFASTSLETQPFWLQIKADITSRMKMSAKQIPNL